MCATDGDQLKNLVITLLSPRARGWCADASDQLQVAGREIRSTFEDGNDATIAKALGGSVFVEVEAALLLFVEEVEVFFGKFLDCPVVLASSKGCNGVDSEAIGIDV